MNKEYTYIDERWFTIVIDGDSGGHYVDFYCIRDCICRGRIKYSRIQS